MSDPVNKVIENDDDINRYLQEIARHGVNAPKPTKPVFTSGATSNPYPPLHLIPRPALVAISRIFEKGVISHKERAWNGGCPIEDYIAKASDAEFVRVRLGHAIDHASKAIERLMGRTVREDDLEPEGERNDAGAIMFAGALLACYEELKKKGHPE
jgi:hypothetical protein